MSQVANDSIFVGTTSFCSDCGAILPPLKETGNVVCYTCKKEYSSIVFDNVTTKYTIHFNSKDACAKNIKEDKKRNKDENDDEEGTIVDRKCPKCGNEKMSYATLQLRSADEGQTVFYTCTKCKFKETENS